MNVKAATKLASALRTIEKAREQIEKANDELNHVERSYRSQLLDIDTLLKIAIMQANSMGVI